MSGLYNLVFGFQAHSGELIQLLQKTVRQNTDFDPGRFRDAWVEDYGGELRIRLYTRNGGGNRPDYEPAIASMRAHPWFHSDADDNFDNTYASFWFQVPLAELDEAVAAALKGMAVEPVDTDARWREAIRRVETGETPPPPAIVAMFERLLGEPPE